MIVEKAVNGFIITTGNPGYEEKHVYTKDRFMEKIMSDVEHMTNIMKKNHIYVLEIKCDTQITSRSK